MRNLKYKLHRIRTKPSIIKDIVQSRLYYSHYEKISRDYIRQLKKTQPYSINPAGKIKLNKLCCIEDWQNEEIKNTLHSLGNESSMGIIQRKDWEWALGIIAMNRFSKLGKDSLGVGVGAGKEAVLFYLANKIKHVYATDLYDDNEWPDLAPSDFIENPGKYAPFPYNEEALTIMKMDGTRLEFPSDRFDIGFSFSSIEHFGGNNHSGALKGMLEIERTLKPGGLAVITTEYIINDKDHPEFFNSRTIYSDLIDKLGVLQLVDPLDLRITANTLDTVAEYYSVALEWKYRNKEFKKNHPHIVVRHKDILITPIMLVFQKSRK
jgi:SAM-dependent methyltransferase